MDEDHEEGHSEGLGRLHRVGHEGVGPLDRVGVQDQWGNRVVLGPQEDPAQEVQLGSYQVDMLDCNQGGMLDLELQDRLEEENLGWVDPLEDLKWQ